VAPWTHDRARRCERARVSFQLVQPPKNAWVYIVRAAG
jgi:hypothetical protein